MSLPAQPVVPLPVLPIMEYDRGDALSAEHARVTLQMLVQAVLCGPAVAMSAIVLSGSSVAVQFHTAVFACLILVSVRAGITLRSLQVAVTGRGAASYSGALQLAERVALLALVVLAAAPLLWFASGFASPSVLVFVLLACTFLALSVTSWRHVPMYRRLSGWAAATQAPRLARRLIWLGGAKAVCETVWLACCAATLLAVGVASSDTAVTFAFAALLGVGVFGVLWVWMIVEHAILNSRVRRLAGRRVATVAALPVAGNPPRSV